LPDIGAVNFKFGSFQFSFFNIALHVPPAGVAWSGNYGSRFWHLGRAAFADV